MEMSGTRGHLAYFELSGARDLDDAVDHEIRISARQDMAQSRLQSAPRLDARLRRAIAAGTGMSDRKGDNSHISVATHGLDMISFLACAAQALGEAMIHRATTTGRSSAKSAFATGLVVLLLVLMTGACAVKLAPDYDQSIVDGLGKLNDNAQEFFAAIAGGSSKSDFAKEDSTYSKLIGEVNALLLQARARPEPPPPAALAWLAPSQPTDHPLPAKSPTPDILNNMAKTLTDMRKQNQKAGLMADDVEDFKRSFDQKMSQALTYEKALKR